MRKVVARVGRAHGLRGEVTVEVRTDDPDRRLVPGAVLCREGAPQSTLTVETAHWHSGVLLLSFVEVPDRTGAEGLRGVVLEAEVEAQDDDDPDAWYDEQLVGLVAQAPDGTALGTVTRVEHLPAQDLITVRRPDGVERLVPFVTALVPVVDVAGGRLVVADPGGLISDVEQDDA